jgi:6-phosphogluconolactonase (cycloisomerase 2 family)
MLAAIRQPSFHFVTRRLVLANPFRISISTQRPRQDSDSGALRSVRRSWKILPQLVLLLVVVPLLGGCGKFFSTTTTTTTTTGSTGNYLYVANATVSSIAGFSVGTSALSAISGLPTDLGVAPSALAANPAGTFLYASSLAGAIYGYSIASNGTLALLNSNNPVVSQISPVAIKVDPSGNWLIAVDLTPAAYVFSINASTGLLTSAGNVPLDPGTPNRIVFTPDNTLAYVSLGTGGVDILTFNASSGVLTKTSQILNPLATANADQGLAVDPANKFLFVAETGLNGLRVFSITAGTGALSEATGSPYTTGLGPSGVLVDSTGSYVYTANRSANNISAFLLSASGSLTAINGSPFTTGTNPVDLAEDVTDAHVAVVCSGGTPDLQLFSISTVTPGALTSFGTATTGTDPTGAVAIAAAK